ncbi:DUF4492 domain-containing protein [Sulfurimonas sp.]|uniref:DUF4492 domain-containing protein n=1 Tax=Sulfurimonas sp. TaxID=2022749 RepID=UPI002607A711|nr:DUF4492 domain-containing protein [Sulfurimonas sp.]
MKNRIVNFFKWIYFLYYDGFTSMKVGKTLWLLIVIKLFVMFVIVKWLFFPDVLKENFHSDEERSAYILDTLTKER